MKIYESSESLVKLLKSYKFDKPTRIKYSFKK